jgi:hypothetical protein
MMAILAVGGGVHGIARIGQGRDELAVQVGIVFNDKQAHGNSLGSSLGDS